MLFKIEIALNDCHYNRKFEFLRDSMESAFCQTLPICLSFLRCNSISLSSFYWFHWWFAWTHSQSMNHWKRSARRWKETTTLKSWVQILPYCTTNWPNAWTMIFVICHSSITVLWLPPVWLNKNIVKNRQHKVLNAFSQHTTSADVIQTLLIHSHVLFAKLQ